MAASDTFDGFDVTLYEGKFTGAFDLEESPAYDDMVAFVVTTRVTGASLDEARNGDLKRVNKFQIISAVPLEDKAAATLLTTLQQQGDDDEEAGHNPALSPGQMSFEEAVPPFADETLNNFLYSETPA